MNFLLKKILLLFCCLGFFQEAHSVEAVAQGTSFLGLILSQENPCEEFVSASNTKEIKTLNKAIEKSNPAICFNKRIVQNPLDPKYDATKKSYAGDVAACNCLSSSQEPAKDQGLVAADALLSLQNARLNSLRNEVSFQASTIAPEVENMYVRSEDKTVGVEGRLSDGLLEKNFEEVFNMTVKSKNEEDPVIGKVHNFFDDISKKTKNPSFNKKLFTEDKDSTNDKQCITSREYLGFNTIPRSNLFFESLRGMDAKSFNEHDWDALDLVKKLRSMKNDPKKDQEKEQIKARLRFLNRNPLIRNLFSLNKSEIDTSILSDSRKNEIKNNSAWNNLSKLKQTLFNTVLKLAPKKRCEGPSDRSCLGQVADPDTMTDYRNSLANIFGGKESSNLADLLVWENENNLANATVKPFYLKPYDGKWMNLPQSQDALDQILQTSENLSTKECFPMNSAPLDPKMINVCRDIFKKYCPLVQVATAEETSSQRSQSKQELEEAEENYSWMTDLEPDMEKNSSMRKLNDSICHMNRKLDPAKLPKGMNYPSTISYSNFKNLHCKGDKKCEDNTTLLPFFMSLYPTSESENENENEIKAFTSYVNENKALKGRSENEYEAMKNAQISSTDRASRSERSASKIARMQEFAARTIGEMLTPNNSDSSEGGFFDSLKNIIPSFSAPESAENSASAYNSYQSVTPSTSTGTEAKSSEISSKINDESDEKDELKEKLSDTQEQLRNAKSQSERKELENRLALLEQRLKDKDEAIAKYQKMLDGIKNNSTADNSQVATSSAHGKRAPASTDEDNAQIANNKSQNMNHNQNSQIMGASSAPKNDNNSVGSNKISNSSFGAHSSATSERSKSNSLNDVLLAKYGIVVDGKENGQVILGKDKEPKDLMKLEVATKTGQGLELKNVSLDVYSGFESKNDETLKNYVKMVESMPAQVVKVSVSTAGRSQVLQFYAIKESGKVVFQPIRSASLKNLKSELQDNR